MLQSKVLDIYGTKKKKGCSHCRIALRHAGFSVVRGRYHQFCAERLRLFDYLLFATFATNSDRLQKALTVYTTGTLPEFMCVCVCVCG